MLGKGALLQQCGITTFSCRLPDTETLTPYYSSTTCYCYFYLSFAASAFIILLAFLLGGLLVAIFELVTSLRNKAAGEEEKPCTFGSEMKNACCGCFGDLPKPSKKKATEPDQDAQEKDPEKDMKTDAALA